MVRIKSRDFTSREYGKALDADSPTRKQKAVLAIWDAIETNFSSSSMASWH